MSLQLLSASAPSLLPWFTLSTLHTLFFRPHQSFVSREKLQIFTETPNNWAHAVWVVRVHTFLWPSVQFTLIQTTSQSFSGSVSIVSRSSWWETQLHMTNEGVHKQLFASKFATFKNILVRPSFHLSTPLHHGTHTLFTLTPRGESPVDRNMRCAQGNQSFWVKWMWFEIVSQAFSLTLFALCQCLICLRSQSF